MKRMATSIIAGVMNITVGSINLLGVFGIAIAVVWSQKWIDWATLTFLWIVFAVLLVFSIPSLIGGIYAIKRKNWAIALISSIASLITWFGAS